MSSGKIKLGKEIRFQARINFQKLCGFVALREFNWLAKTLRRYEN